MKIQFQLFIAILVFLLIPNRSYAAIRDPEGIEKLLADSNILFEGFVIKAEFAQCADGKIKYVYTLKKTKVWKGSIPVEEVKACGDGGALLLGQRYFVAGNAVSGDKIEFKPEGVYLIFSTDRYFRPITYDTPIVVTQKNQAYAVGFEDYQFIQNLKNAIKNGDGPSPAIKGDAGH